MKINIRQIIHLLNSYHRQQFYSRLPQSGGGCLGGSFEPPEQALFMSGEAKRLQVYQRTAEEVFKRARNARPQDDGIENDTPSPQSEIPTRIRSTDPENT